MAETAEQKAVRYISEGRLTVMRVLESGLIAAECRGSDAVYVLGYDPREGRKEWRCSCEASKTFGRRCCHLRALQLVTVRPT